MYQISEDDPDSQIFARAKTRGQRTFTLVEQDATAVECIAFWIMRNIETAPDDKLRDALERCLEMRKFTPQKHAD